MEISKQNNQLHTEQENNTILCSVCIATYRRPLLLHKLLKSLETQMLPGNVNLEIIVVDNDTDQTAKPIVMQFSNTSRIKFYYYTQAIKNISNTRNLSVEKSSGQFLLFIDDDETASPNWVSNLLNTLNTYSADGVFGRVIPEFYDDAPLWLRLEQFYYSPMTPTGTEAKFHYAGNCLIKASLVKKIKAPFDIQYGVTGGEDAHLFEKLLNQGAFFVNCREAFVFEYIPQERTKISYLLKRGFRGGSCHTRRMIENAKKISFFVRFFMLIKAFIYGITSLFLMIIFFPNKIHRTKWLIKLASNTGRFLAVFGWHYQMYKR
jgi:succinoglycan biosynthesis protein ExoM